jgi:nitrous-oxide reductase
LGPLHTEFDGQGYAYTSMFVSSEIVKWSLKDFKVADRIPVYYSIGHLMIPGGDSRKPFGKYVIALNKITKDRYLPTGPELAQSAQLIDITGAKMQSCSTSRPSASRTTPRPCQRRSSRTSRYAPTPLPRTRIRTA